MIISVNWLKKFVDIDVSIEQLTTLIGERLVEIEAVTPLAEKYQDVVIVKVVECRPIEDSDHLNLTKIDDGGIVDGVERDEHGYVQVVCGAPNVQAEMLAAWLPPGSTVPETFTTNAPVVLGARPLRGYVSNGMLASAKELDLFDDHTGIVVVDKAVAPGASFAETYELDDYLLDIENKSLTHRPDAFGIIGFAREVAAIQGKAFQTPDWLAQVQADFHPVGEVVQPPKITIEDVSLSDRFATIVLSGADGSRQSPLEVQTYLARSGMRPISALVDVTNYLMLLTGQPLHSYDYDKLLRVAGGLNEINVRTAHDGEKLVLIDGREITMSSDDIVIAAGEVAVGLAGAMGGAATETDTQTTRILLEAATFDLYKLRATQMRHGIFSEAITRFTKGVPAALAAPVLQRASELFADYTGATVISPMGEAYPGKTPLKEVVTSLTHINSVLGTQLSAQDIAKTLSDAEFSVKIVGDTVTVAVPYWRHDIAIPEDVAEEIGRLRGFDKITVTLPQRDFVAVRPDSFDILRQQLRRLLVRAGANEVLTYSFVPGDMMRKARQEPDDAYRIVNSISPELQYYRQSLTPSLLNAVHPNVKAGFDHFGLFELNKFHTKRHELTDENVPLEQDSLGFVLTRTKSAQGAAFYEVKQYLEFIADSLGVHFLYEPLGDDTDYPVTQPFEPKRSAIIWNDDKTVRVGVLGEYRASVRRAFKLPDYTAGFEVSPRALLHLTRGQSGAYQPLSRYPSVERDVCFQVPIAVTYAQLWHSIMLNIESAPFSATVVPVDLYQPTTESVRNITVRFTMTSYERTLTGQEVNAYMETLTEAVTKTTEGRVI